MYSKSNPFWGLEEHFRKRNLNRRFISDSQNRSQYETLAETSFREYSVLTHGGTQQHNVMNRASAVADNNCAKEENSYVNLVLSNTET